MCLNTLAILVLSYQRYNGIQSRIYRNSRYDIGITRARSVSSSSSNGKGRLLSDKQEIIMGSACFIFRSVVILKKEEASQPGLL